MFSLSLGQAEQLRKCSIKTPEVKKKTRNFSLKKKEIKKKKGSNDENLRKLEPQQKQRVLIKKLSVHSNLSTQLSHPLCYF